MNQKEVMKRYHKEFFLAIGTYTIVLIGSISILKTTELSKAIQFIIAIAPVIPVAFVVLAIIRFIRDSDELQQRAHLYAGVFSCIATGLITFSYGLLENVGLPRFDIIWVLPLMLMFWGISLRFFWQKYQ